MRLLDVYTRGLSGLKYELVCRFMADMVREFLWDADEPAFLERELMGLGVDGY